MVDIGYLAATDKIVLAGQRSSVELEIETVTSMVPGVLVKIGATNNEMVVNDGNAAFGWLGYEDSPVMWRPANIDATYAVVDSVNPRAAVVFGPGIVLRAKLADGTNVSMGDRLVGTTAGALKIWAHATTEEPVVAIAMEDKTTDGAEVNIIVRSLI